MLCERELPMWYWLQPYQKFATLLGWRPWKCEWALVPQPDGTFLCPECGVTVNKAQTYHASDVEGWS